MSDRAAGNKKLTLFVDRMEEGLAVLHTEDLPPQELIVDPALLPERTQEGDWLSVIFERDAAKKADAAAEIADIMNSLGDAP